MPLPKHHYIPVFYLKQWTDAAGRLYEFSRPAGADVNARDCGPKGTGYVRGLYRLEYLDDERAERFERIFFGQVDSLAKQALDVCLQGMPEKWDIDLRSAWSRFILGMLFRNPERIEAIRKYIEDITLDNFEDGQAQYDAIKGENDPPTYLDYLVGHVTFSALDWTADLMNLHRLGEHLNNMRWSVRDVTDGGLKLFTSDRPILMTNGLAHDTSELVVPISPTKAFIACNSPIVEHTLQRMGSLTFARACNVRVLKFAQKYAWNINDDLINAANKYLSLEARDDQKFWEGAPSRPPPELAEQSPV